MKDLEVAYLQFNPVQALALTSCSFDFTRSECFVSGQGQAGKAAERALDAFQALLMQAQPLPFLLQADKALLINNLSLIHI